MQGTVKYLNASKGFGFIETAANKDFFFHGDDTLEGLHNVSRGMTVTFSTQRTNKGPRAVNVRQTTEHKVQA